MPVAGPLDRLSLWLLLLITIGTLLVSVEVGYRLGKYRLRRAAEEHQGHVLALLSGTMGLLAFVLAFTFGLASTRFEGRKQIMVDEANAVRTTYLRADLLPEASAARVRALLREYVELRLSAAASPDSVERVLLRSEELHRELWKEAAAAGRDHPESTAAGLFVDALNKAIELHATRVKVAIGGRIPWVLWAALVLVSVVTMATAGYHAGLVKTGRSLATAALVLNLSIVLMLIADLDRPQEGTLRVSQQAMIDLRRTMSD